MSISTDHPNVGSQVFAVIIGGMIGAVLRFLLSHYLQEWTKPIPIAPLIVNAVGSFLIGLTNALIARSGRPLGFVSDLVVTGLYGALTTWSTVIFDSFTIITAPDARPPPRTEPIVAIEERGTSNTNSLPVENDGSSIPFKPTSMSVEQTSSPLSVSPLPATNAQPATADKWCWSLPRWLWGCANVFIHIAICLALVWFGAAAGNSFHTSVVPL